MNSELIVILCTVPSKEVGERIAGKLVDDKLAACVNIIGGLTSIYRWKGESCRDNEHLLVIKSRSSLFEILKEVIISNHPYEVPEIICLPIMDGHLTYLNWILDNTRS